MSILFLALLTPACASPLAETPPPSGLPQDLGVQATVEPAPPPAEETPGETPPKKGNRHRDAEERDPAADEEGAEKPDGNGGKGGKGGGKGKPEPEAGGFAAIGSSPDPAGDAGLKVPPYADIVNILVEDDGANARVTAEMSGAIPEKLPQGEVAGVGVDLTRGPDDGEGDYQVFASGDPAGWFGYLYAEGGFVEFTGSFELIGNRLVFTVPWEVLGGRQPGTLAAFADWSGPGPIDANPSGADIAPDSGEATFG